MICRPASVAVLVLSLAPGATLAHSASQATPPSTPTTAQPLSAPTVPITPDRQAQAEAQFRQLPWPVQLGMRVAAAEALLPVVPQVVLVPDEATFIDEVGKWSLKGRWPVLIEDDRFAPLFVRAFKPQRVVRRTSVGPLPAGPELMLTLDGVVSLAWGGEPGRSPQEAFAKVGFVPPGAVITSIDDPAWPAALALAAGRGQPLLFIDGDLGGLDDVLDPAQFAAVKSVIEKALTDGGYPFRGVGDPIETVTIARTMAPRAKVPQPPALRPALPPSAGFGADDPLATLDLLFRNDDGSRYAIGGWIFGPSQRSAYMAMCSLFLTREELWFFSGYPKEGFWNAYEVVGPAGKAKEVGFTTRTWDGDTASLLNWRRMLLGGIGPDVLLMNSSGDPDWFSLGGNERGRVADIPFLRKPLALGLIHSWSMKRPGDRETVGGRWLERGVYSYFGSVHEPFLGAFVPPTNVIDRVASFAPFLVSCRMLDGEFGKPWRLVAIGDPLMPVRVPGQRKVPIAAVPADGATDLRAETVRRLKAVQANPQADEFRAVMKDLLLLGEDEVAIGLWKFAAKTDFKASLAQLALGPLFRARDFDGFVAAFRLIRERTPDDFDLLWHLASPRITGLDELELMLLFQSLRGPDPSVDLAVILPGLDRVIGREGADRLIDIEVKKAKGANADPNVISRLEALRNR
jgi:hypothetical protein